MPVDPWSQLQISISQEVEPMLANPVCLFDRLLHFVRKLLVHDCDELRQVGRVPEETRLRLIGSSPTLAIWQGCETIDAAAEAKTMKSGIPTLKDSLSTAGPHFVPA